MMFVLVASVVVDLLLQREPFYSRIKMLIRSADWLVAPHLMDIEVVQVLRRFVLRGELSSQRAEEAVRDLQDLPIERYPHTAFLLRVFSLRNNLTAYDALYLVLAEILQATLLTRDTAFAEVSGSGITVTVIS